MKDHKVVPSTNGVATIKVAGQTRHYFQSEKLGSCYAFKPTPPDDDDEFDPDLYSDEDLFNDLPVEHCQYCGAETNNGRITCSYCLRNQ